MKLEITDWNKPDAEGTINVPDELDKIFNSVGRQFNFVKYSGKNEIQAIADIVHGCQKFFKEMYENKMQGISESVRITRDKLT